MNFFNMTFSIILNVSIQLWPHTMESYALVLVFLLFTFMVKFVLSPDLQYRARLQA